VLICAAAEKAAINTNRRNVNRFIEGGFNDKYEF
jgi:hypothetical protein